MAETTGKPNGEDSEPIELRIREDDYRDLRILDRSDIGFAALYGVLLVWGMVLTLLATF